MTTKSEHVADGHDLLSYTIPFVGKLIGCGSPGVRRAIESGELFAFQTNDRNCQRRRIRIPDWALREFMAKRAVVTTTATKATKKRVSAVVERY